jgi:hypothetical protein
MDSLALATDGTKALTITIVPKAPPRPLPASNARGGDLLFFEGLPFWYLKHIEELPPPSAHAHAHARPFNAMGSHTYKETLHDMINLIVKMETSWTENHNVCSIAKFTSFCVKWGNR